MTGKRHDTEGNWVDPDDAPEWTQDQWDRAEIRIGDKLIRRARPPGPSSRPAPLRLDSR